MTNETVLVVDSNCFARTVLRAIIKASYPHLNVIEAQTEDDALANNPNHNVKWIIVDYDIGGFKLIESLKQHNPQAHISAICLKHQETIQNKIKASGLNCISKPIEEHYVLSFFDHTC